MQEKQELSKKEMHNSHFNSGVRSERSPVSYFQKKETFEIMKVTFSKKENAEETSQDSDPIS